LFLGVEVLVGVDPVGNPCQPFGGPVALVHVHRTASYSSFTLAALITLCQRSTSARMNAAVASGVPPTGSAERSSNRLRTSGCRTASAMSALIFATTAAGVFGGATTPNHAADPKPRH